MKKKLKIVIFLLILIFVVFASLYSYFKVQNIYNPKVIIKETPKQIRIMSYNMNHGEDSNGGYGLKEIIEIIKSQQPDIVTLNDVDFMAVRTYREDQARKIAGNLGMNFTYGKINKIEGGWNGNAILSKYPLAYSGNKFFRDKDGNTASAFLHGIYELGDLKFHVITTELSEDDEISEKQTQEMVDKIQDYITRFAINDPIVLTGSLNMNNQHSSIKDLDNYFVNSTKKVDDKLTFPAANPVEQADYLFFRKNIKLLSVKILNNNNTRNSSDHLPIISEFLLR